MESEIAASRKGSNAFSDVLGSMKTHPALMRALYLIGRSK